MWPSVNVLLITETLPNTSSKYIQRGREWEEGQMHDASWAFAALWGQQRRTWRWAAPHRPQPLMSSSPQCEGGRGTEAAVYTQRSVKGGKLTRRQTRKQESCSQTKSTASPTSLKKRLFHFLRCSPSSHEHNHCTQTPSALQLEESLSVFTSGHYNRVRSFTDVKDNDRDEWWSSKVSEKGHWFGQTQTQLLLQWRLCECVLTWNWNTCRKRRWTEELD